VEGATAPKISHGGPPILLNWSVAASSVYIRFSFVCRAHPPHSRPKHLRLPRSLESLRFLTLPLYGVEVRGGLYSFGPQKNTWSNEVGHQRHRIQINKNDDWKRPVSARRKPANSKRWPIGAHRRSIAINPIIYDQMLDV